MKPPMRDSDTPYPSGSKISHLQPGVLRWAGPLGQSLPGAPASGNSILERIYCSCEGVLLLVLNALVHPRAQLGAGGKHLTDSSTFLHENLQVCGLDNTLSLCTTQPLVWCCHNRQQANTQGKCV